MIVTLREVAKAAGVHPSTASRALNARTRHLVNQEVAARVMALAEQLDYRPDAAASALRSGRSRLVGTLVPGIANPVFAPILAGAAEVLRRGGMSLIVADTGLDSDAALELVQELAARRVDGLLLATTLRQPDPSIELARLRNIPVVLINRGLPDIDSVMPDNVAGVELALRHLCGLGHRRIGYLSGFANAVAGTGRRETFIRLMQAAGLSADLVQETHHFDRAGGRAGALALLARAPDMTALVCGNDLIATGAYDAARELGLSIPGQLSVTGFNDLPLMDLLAPALTSVRVDFHALGSRAAAILLEQLERRGFDQAPPVMEYMPAELMVRGSTARPPA